MKTLTKKSQETLNKLESKSQDNIWHEKAKHRMPRLSCISNLLSELNIPHTFMNHTRGTECRGEGQPIATKQGSVDGHLLRVFNTEIDIDTTDNCFNHRQGTQQEACRDILNLIKNK